MPPLLQESVHHYSAVALMRSRCYRNLNVATVPRPREKMPLQEPPLQYVALGRRRCCRSLIADTGCSRRYRRTPLQYRRPREKTPLQEPECRYNTVALRKTPLQEPQHRIVPSP